MATDLLSRLVMPEGGGRILCALSGGADSMCLLHLLYQNRETLGIELEAAHFEHGIRGEESGRDAAFAQRECEKLGIPLRTGHGRVPQFAEETHMGMEEAARTLRYRFLEEAADEADCDWIATAHNADDNAETMLFHLCRGSGSLGLSGIAPRRGRIIRPLLQISRSEIEQWLAQQGIPYVSDSSNDDDTYSRNRIRHQILPVMKSLNPEAVTAMGRAARLLRQDEDCLRALAVEFIQMHCAGQRVPCKELLALHPAVSSRVLRHMCPKPLQEGHVQALLSLTEGMGRGFCDVPGLRVRREQGYLWLTEKEEEPLPEREILLGKTIMVPEAGISIAAKKSPYPGEIHGLFKTYWIKCESICGKLICSSARPGDKLSLRERNCTKSLKALFLEKKMTRNQRLLCPVIRDSAGALLVPAFGEDKRCRPNEGDEAICLDINTIEE